MAIFLGLGVALSIGSADFISGLVARRVPTAAVVAFSQLAGLAPLGIYMAITDRSIPSNRDLLLGIMAGGTLVVGIVCLVRGLAVGRMSVVAPTSAALGSAVGVGYGVIVGERPGIAAIVGVALAIAAVGLIARVAEHHEFDSHAPAGRARTTVAARSQEMFLAVTSGLILGVTQLFFAEAGDDAGMWPIAGSRLSSGVLAGTYVLWRALSDGPPKRPSGGDMRMLSWYTLLETMGVCLLIEGFRQGLVSLVSPVASLFPAITVLWARLILRDRMNRGQVVGFGCAAVGVLLIALG